MANAKLSITMNRSNGTIAVDSTSTRIYTRDENVDVTVSGFTSGEAAKIPYLQLSKRGLLLAQSRLTVPLGGDGTLLTGTMSTNTAQFAMLFGNSQRDAVRFVDCRIFATNEENPFAFGEIEVYNFPSTSGHAPDNLVSGSEAIAAVDEKIDNHVENASNPHGVTAAQVGALTQTAADGRYPSQSSFNSLSTTVSTANQNITALQSAMQTANLAIQSNMVAITTKANAADVYRKDMTYNKAEVNGLFAQYRGSATLAGKTFSMPTNDKERNALLAYVVRELGGNIATSGIVPGTAPSQITMTAADGTARNLKIVKSEGEYTTEVV